MPDAALTALKLLFLALLYLFFLRVLRAVWAETNEPVAAPQPRAGGGGPAPRPAAPAAPRARRGAPPAGGLRVVEPAEQRGATYAVGDEATVGRAAGCHVALDDSTVSQLHARLFREGNRLLVEDLGSTNGTFVNRRRIARPTPLRKGDRVQVGQTVLEVTA